ncbi:hypothetical protein BC826DRAFT_89668 [Russula brevipes]|nr:hypothetical protein BC826DRAFT_89668 [Russula brevipes]
MIKIHVALLTLKNADKRQRQSGSAKTLAKTSSFCPSLWKPKRLPLFAHLHSDLQTKMLDVTPRDMFLALRTQCSYAPFRLNYEGGSTALSDYLAHLVSGIYHALTGNMSSYEVQERSSSNQVISDFSYQVDDRVKILGEVKSPLTFDYFIGAFMDQMRDGSPAKLCIESAPTIYRGYESIFANLGSHAFDIWREYPYPCPTLHPRHLERDHVVREEIYIYHTLN